MSYHNNSNNTSWRFIDRDHTFANPLAPWASAFPEDITITSLPATDVDFKAVKIGDVNDSAVPSSSQPPCCGAFVKPAGDFLIHEPRRKSLKAGQYYTFPVITSSNKPLIAWQAAFRFDPDILELVGPSIADVQELSADNFNLAQSGEGIIRALWFSQPDATEQELQPGQTLFNLTFRIKRDMTESSQMIQIDESLMPALAWTKEEVEYRLKTAQPDLMEPREEQVETTLPGLVRCMPNPGSGTLTFEIAAYPKKLF